MLLENYFKVIKQVLKILVPSPLLFIPIIYSIIYPLSFFGKMLRAVLCEALTKTCGHEVFMDSGRIEAFFL